MSSLPKLEASIISRRNERIGKEERKKEDEGERDEVR
jgi:hypothetical protein